MSESFAEDSAPGKITRIHGSNAAAESMDVLAIEEPLEIRVQGKSIAVTMRTPGHDRELAAGFLLAEGILRERNDVIEISPCPSAIDKNILNVFLAPSVKIELDKLSRHVFASSSCGLCGKASIEEIHQHFPPITVTQTVSREILWELPAKLQNAQKLFARTGAVHGAGLFDTTGNLILLREDVGRHNAVDKVIGHAWLNGLVPLDRHILVVSGRASFEIMQKALAARIPIIVAISGPSSLAVEFAQESGQTLVGFLRQHSLNIYSHAGRISTNP